MLCKRIFWFVLFCILAVVYYGPVFAEDKVGEFKEVTGDVSVRSGRGEVRKVQADAPVFPGDTITTGIEGKARVDFEGGNTLILGFDSSLRVETVVYDRDKKHSASVFELLRGKTRAIVKKLLTPGSQFKMKTSTSLIGVLGTVFTLSYDVKSGLTEVFNESGLIEISSVDNMWPAIKVKANYRTKINKGSGPSKPEAFPADKNPYKGELTLEQDKKDKIREVTLTPPPEDKAVGQDKWGRMLMEVLPYENSRDFPDWSDEDVAQLLEGIPDKDAGIDEFRNVINNPQLIPHGVDGQMAITVVEDSATVFYYPVFPASGPVKISSRLKGGSQYWTLGGAPTVISRNQVVVSDVDIGEIDLKKGGIKRLGISIPRDGKLISFSFKAYGKSPVMPRDGWQMKNKLNNYDMAQTILQTLSLQDKLPLSDGSSKTIKGEKKEAKGGLSGFEYDFGSFKMEREDFCDFSFRNSVPGKQIFIIDGYLKITKFSSDDASHAGSEMNPYLKKGEHRLIVFLSEGNYPGDITLNLKDNSFKAYREILEKEGFIFGKESYLVGDKLAKYNISLLKQLLETEDDDIAVPVRKKEQEELIKRRSLSPVLPHEESKERYVE